MKTIRQLREARGESETQLAAAVRVTHAQVVAWERGLERPSVSSLRALTAHFGVDSADIDLEPDRPPSLGERLADAFDV